MRHLAWETVKKEVLNDKLWRKVISGEKVMVGQISLAKGCVVPVHQHVHEQISCVMQGRLKFNLEGRELTVSAGEVLVIPSNAPHGVVALEDSQAFDIFSPIREDWLNGTDSYLRK
jgi:unsaturated pyranuronate lyase